MVKLTAQNRHDYAQSVLRAINAENIQQFRELFFELHPQDQLEIYLETSHSQRQKMYEYLSPEEFAEIFEELQIEDQKKYLLELNETYAQDMISHMSADNVADFLGEIHETKASAIIEGLEEKDAQDIKELLAYEEETAGAIMTKEFISLRASSTIKEVIEVLRQEGPDAETIYYLYVINEKFELVGVVSLRDLITSEPDSLVETVMSSRVVSVPTSEDQENVATLFKKYDFLAVPVTTETNKLVGIITVDDILDVMEEEATEDIGEFAASRGATDLTLSAFSAAKKRAPWIILLMFFGMITAGVIGQFEETLESVVLLAGFIPLIMDSAGNTGTQSLAVAVRSLALGQLEKKSLSKMVMREFGTGLMLGLMCAVTLMIIIPFLHGSVWLAFIVGVSIFLSLSIATVIGTIVPLAINKMKLDPAIASGPFITTVNDIIGLLIYFSIATSLIAYL
ncbi:magnesium transporter [Salipaludibacillus agaradhaerens]|uniref:Magnesium transporter MgtE n=1 Tax=Salipaludibacillus agaradhaerens TaxID=76935 RepID=A0A9Q4G0J1_SALAG|nr:magnesium transporter [Salipaludibacillus agaradhaerens]MCR6097879.1 magnesium transporter [Salipaludibacillus agaradhaerens]MCR6105266.1 magnesium transporter [Salipaludibacillus agaradhaerens]MCR6116492.1 magnesium transporter [Salipaludibacillus agaradhaerens]MCR6117307.1 magnesium transporter [Salipaludibacillus agaradhaerens]